jgi:hypothetical protein
VRLRIDQGIAAPPDAVVAVFADPAFYPRLGALERIAPPEVLSCDDDGARATLRIRYRFAGSLPSAARRVLDPAKLTWIDTTVIDRAARSSTFEILPDHYRDRLQCRGSVTYEPAAGSTTVQRVDGDVVVHYPLVGRLVEQAIVSGYRDQIAEAARLVADVARGA